MAQTVIELSEEHFQRIGTFVRSHFHEWLLEDRRVSGDILADQLNRIENALEASIILTRERFELMVQRFEAMDRRFEAMDQRFEAMDRRFEMAERNSNERFELMEQRFELVDKRFDEVNARMNRQFTVLLSVSGTLFAGIVGLLLQGFLL